MMAVRTGSRSRLALAARDRRPRRCVRRAAARQAPAPRLTLSFNDSHFHLTNYVQEGIDIRDVPEDHGQQGRPIDAVRHPAAAAMGVRATPATSPPRTTCRPTRRSTTTRSPTPTSRWRIASLTQGGAGALRSDDHRLQSGGHVRGRSHQPRADDVSRRVLPASASSRIHKEFVSVEDRRRDGQPHSTRRSIGSSTSPAKSGSS